MFRIFDKNKDGFVDKNEFKEMTTSKMNNRKIDLFFKVIKYISMFSHDFVEIILEM